MSRARKLQALKALLYPELVFQVRRVALTPDHVRQHGLSSSPLKDTEKHADRWCEKMGVEQTEIDAPAALRRDLLGQIASQAIAPFFDPTLTDRCSEASEDWRRACQRAIDAQTDQTRLAALRGEAEHVLATQQAEIDRLNRELSIDPDAYQLPAPVLPQPVITAEPDGSPLIDSAWVLVGADPAAHRVKAYDGDGAP